MAKWGKVDFKELKKLRDRVGVLIDSPEKQQAFMEDCAKELAGRLLARVTKRTPVGQYPQKAGKLGGTLRRGWTGGKAASAKGYTDSLAIQKVGGVYQIEIINPTEYASYVEFGHRTRDHKGWVKGRFMLTIAEEEIREAAPAVLEKKLQLFLKGAFK